MPVLVAIFAVVSWAFYAVALVVIARLFFLLPKLDRFLSDAPAAATSKLAQRLSELDIARRENLVTPDEYAAKRAEILKDL
jgi:hypothetical protein